MTFAHSLYSFFILLSSVDCYLADSAYNQALNTTWETFWNHSKAEWNTNDPSCNNDFSYPALWDAAVASRATTDNGSTETTDLVTKGLKNTYLNNQGWFSASNAKNGDVYVDDNAQVLWVLLDAYKTTSNNGYLEDTEQLMKLIQGQWAQDFGGVRWSLDGDYIASISTTEAALDAVLLFEVNNDKSLLEFAANCTDWLWDNLRDKDNLLFDGITISSGKVNTGKLTYTVGTMMSTLVRLAKQPGNSTFTDRAYQLANAALNTTGPFYDGNGLWNNDLKYSHLLVIGLVDLINLGNSDAKYSEDRKHIIDEIHKQTDFIFQFLQFEPDAYVNDVYSASKSIYDNFTQHYSPQKAYEPNSSLFCNNEVSDTPKKNLLLNGSATQIFWAVGRLHL